MLQSTLFPKTKKQAPKDAESINHKLLVRAGFIDQLMAGSWTLLPLGWRVVAKINQIIREEMNAIGALEMLMPLLHPKEIWNQTGRWEKAKEVMYQFKDSRDKEFALSFTHEEIVMDLLRKNIKSYQDLPVYLYHFSTKFRNEARPRSGILRGREFLMKDLYSAHTSEKDMLSYYEIVKQAYIKAFKRIGFNIKVAEASGGVFTDRNTHEFQVLADGGEDYIFYCDKCNYALNKEIFKGKSGDMCNKCKKGNFIGAKSIEVGNIFPLGTWYSERMRAYFVDKDGKKKPIWFASYGIGQTRTMGAWVEISHDEKGIIWNKVISPFAVHLIELKTSTFAKATVDRQDLRLKTKEIYNELTQAGIEVLYDDRDISAGEKFAEADLIGIPIRLVVSYETGNKIEWKARTSDNKELLSLSKIIDRLKS